MVSYSATPQCSADGPSHLASFLKGVSSLPTTRQLTIHKDLNGWGADRKHIQGKAFKTNKRRLGLTLMYGALCRRHTHIHMYTMAEWVRQQTRSART